MNSKTILLVEDNPSDVELTKRAFVREHITNEIVVAEDGQTAFAYLFGTGRYAGRDLNQMPTLILLDLKLPIVDGLEVLAVDRNVDLALLENRTQYRQAESWQCEAAIDMMPRRPRVIAGRLPAKNPESQMSATSPVSRSA